MRARSVKLCGIPLKSEAAKTYILEISSASLRSSCGFLDAWRRNFVVAMMVAAAGEGGELAY